LIALSWSRLSDYMQCPKKFHLKYISKSFPKEDENNVHFVKGRSIHKQLEDYVVAKNGQGEMPLGFTPEVKQALPYVDKLYAKFAQVHPEAQIATDINWKPTDWFAPNTAWRAIWDVVGLAPSTCYVGDYKSGKVYPYGSSYGQLHLSAVIALNRFPEVPEVNSAYIYVEHKQIMPVKVTRADLPQVQAHFEAKFQEVQRETAWEPKQNENCKWCPATKGQCKYSKKL
jgi:CRISPR/Cas system-associated exonuclease Cas4 (RecB family)